MSEPQPTYLLKRLAELGLQSPPSIDLLPYYKNAWTELQAANIDDTLKLQLQDTAWFWPDEEGNICILYLNPDGTRTQYRGESRWGKHYTRWRLHPDNITGDQKYGQPPKSGVHLFFTPTVIDAYNAGTKIKTLVLVEGEFKAYAGYLNGLHIIGLPSIWGFKEKESNALHPDLLSVIDRCAPDNIILLHDADALQVKWDEWKADPSKDLGKRLNSFCNSVLKFRELVKPLSETTDFYYSHLSEELLDQKTPDEGAVKGLDDLYYSFTDPANAVIVKQQMEGVKPGGYFNFINLTAASGAKIKEYFLVKKGKRGEPSNFYQKFHLILGTEAFVFEGSAFKFNEDKDYLEYVKHKDADKFVRIGCDYFKLGFVPDQLGLMQRELKPWKKGEISEDYVNAKGLKNFFNDIPKYFSACNVPSHTAFEPVINDCYNLYIPVQHSPEPGDWPTIAMYLHHIFGEEHYQFGLDYLKLLWEQPTQKLPIISLVSKEQGTGKSKFLDFLALIFKENTVVIGNAEIADSFNNDYATKLVICIDEGLIEKRAILEKVKSWVTSKKIPVNQKNVSRMVVPFFGKLIFTSNNVDNFIWLDDEDRRFFVREVPKPPTRDPFLVDKMSNEIDAFLHFLQNRPMAYEHKDELYFDRTVYQTEAKRTIQNNSKTWLEKDLRDLIPDLFAKHNTNKTLVFNISEILQELKASGGNYRKVEVKNLLTKMNVERHYGPIKRDHSGALGYEYGRWYVFNVADWLSDDEQKALYADLPVEPFNAPKPAATQTKQDIAK